MLKKIYIAIILLAFVGTTIVFDTFPRSTKSELEKRALAKFPRFSAERLFSGTFTKEISLWFSDSEPYRDKFMALSMKIKEYEKVKTSEENISFVAADKENELPKEPVDTRTEEQKNRDIEQYENRATADFDAKIAHSGIVITGKGKEVKALMAFGGTPGYTTAFSKMVNTYKKTFGEGVNVYCMVIPTAIEYYLPNKAKDATKPQLPVIKACYEALDSTVKAVDVYSVLGKHAKEPIYLRTDHHWSPLGGFYAAEKFAKVAKVPFKPLSAYERRVVHGYVGSMYGYSRDASIKEAPEDFVYYVPKHVKYTTTYTNYKLDGLNVIGEYRPVQGEYFVKFKDGSGGAYCTFMGGDAKITKVQTGTKNGRRLAIIKDSFGNTLPSCFFYSFEEVHVIDHRYFTPNLTEYVKKNNITDFLFAMNIFSACNAVIAKNMTDLLTQ